MGVGEEEKKVDVECAGEVGSGGRGRGEGEVLHGSEFIVARNCATWSAGRGVGAAGAVDCGCRGVVWRPERRVGMYYRAQFKIRFCVRGSDDLIGR
jgi:hypothetical protein